MYIFFPFEFLYWNIKLDMHVKSGSSKGVSAGKAVPSCALPVQVQQSKPHLHAVHLLMRWSRKVRHSGPVSRPTPWAPEQQKAQGNCVFPFSKTQESSPVECSQYRQDLRTQSTLSLAAAPSCAHRANWWLSSPTRPTQLSPGWHRRKHSCP